MSISIIAAMAANNVIGRGGDLPWHLSDDLKRFKTITMGKPIVMGRRTYESIGRPLPGRQNVVITRQPGFAAPGCDVVSSPAAALRAAGDADEVMIIGGGEIYDLFMNQTTRIYLTRVHADVDGDAFFPQLAPDEWEVVERQVYPAEQGRELAYTYEVLERERATS